MRHAAGRAGEAAGGERTDKGFYDGKLASARFYCKEVLPNIALHKKVIESSDLSLMDVPEAVF